MRVLVCGGRDYADWARVKEVLDALKVTHIIHGAARGADSLGGRYATEHDILSSEFPALWDKYGRAAGPIRNKQMLTEAKPDLVVAFPGGRGTANMVKQAEKAGVSVYMVRDWDEATLF